MQMDSLLEIYSQLYSLLELYCTGTKSSHTLKVLAYFCYPALTLYLIDIRCMHYICLTCNNKLRCRTAKKIPYSTGLAELICIPQGTSELILRDDCVPVWYMADQSSNCVAIRREPMQIDSLFGAGETSVYGIASTGSSHQQDLRPGREA